MGAAATTTGGRLSIAEDRLTRLLGRGAELIAGLVAYMTYYVHTSTTAKPICGMYLFIYVHLNPQAQPPRTFVRYPPPGPASCGCQ